MAVTLNSATLTQPAASSETITVPTLANGAVMCYFDGYTGTMTSVTLGGVSATLLDAGNRPDGVTLASTWIAVGVPSGSQTFSYSNNGAGITIGHFFLEGVDQTTPVNQHTYSTTAAASFTTSASTYIIGIMRDGAVTNSDTLTHQVTIPILTTSFQVVDSNAMVGAGSFTNTWTGTIRCFMVAINQVLTGASPYMPQLLTLNVG